jgi:hypothetical protein
MADNQPPRPSPNRCGRLKTGSTSITKSAFISYNKSLRK